MLLAACNENENRGPMAPCGGLPNPATLGKLAVVSHSAAARLFSALLSAALFFTAGLIVSVLTLFLLRGRRALLSWLMGLVRLVAAALILISHGFDLCCRRPNVDGIVKVYGGPIRLYVTQQPSPK
jgi:hypothetical protein